MNYGNPFDRLSFFENISYYIEKGWGSYKELIGWTMKDFIEIKMGIESKARKAQLEQSLNG